MEQTNQHPVMKKVAFVAGALVLCGYVVLFVSGPQGWQSLREKWNQIETLERENADLKQNVETIRTYNEQVKNKKDTQQLEIRKNLDGFMREGELEFRFPAKTEAATPEKKQP